MVKYYTKKGSSFVVDEDRPIVYGSEVVRIEIKISDFKKTITADQRDKLILFLRNRLKKYGDKELIDEFN